jgi:hypothetical protein
VLAIANPGVIYCTNPSTLSTYLDALESDWKQSSALVRAWVEDPGQFSPQIRKIARRLSSRGDSRRLATISAAESGLGLLEIAPAVALFSCWDGGYVQPFLKRIRERLPAEQVRHLPMYSMSTEVIETLPVFQKDTPAFLPLAKGVRYEFLPVGCPDEPRFLKEAWAVNSGEEVLMVVSDAYGLRRYQTEDVFCCKGLVQGLPDLHFVRRRGLAWSFTGEKITGSQLERVFSQMRRETLGLAALDWMALAPTQPGGDKLPGYVLLLVGSKVENPSEIATNFDAVLSTLNGEFADKCASGRLAPTRVHSLSVGDYVRRVGGQRHQASWEAQFKFLPLICKIWEDMEASLGDSQGSSC